MPERGAVADQGSTSAGLWMIIKRLSAKSREEKSTLPLLCVAQNMHPKPPKCGLATKDDDG